MSFCKDFTNQMQTLKNKVLKHTGDRNSCSEGQRQGGSGGVPLGTKLCYAVGGVPNQITTVAIGVSLQIFLLDVVQLEASYVSMILFVSHVWDAVTDPLVGYLVSRSHRTAIGKLTPWLIFSTPFGVLSYLLLWFEPGGSMSQPLSVAWYLTSACLFETLMSCYNIPYYSLNMFLGGDQKDRDSATAYRTTVEMLAALVASGIQGQVVAVYNTEKQEACQQQDQTQGTAQSTSSSQTVLLQDTQKAFITSALVMGALFFLCSLVLFFGVKEQHAPLCSDDNVRPPYLTSLKMLICHAPYQRLVLSFVFSVLAFQMSLGNFALFCSHAAGLGAKFQYLLLVLLSSSSLAVPVWQAVLLRIGKKATVFIGLSLFIPAVAIVACVPSNLPVFMTMCILMGFSTATIFLLPWSMLPDVVDDFTMRHPTCKDLEPLFFSCFAFCGKLARGLSVGISTMTLQFVGYRVGACNHGDRVAMALIVLFSPVPVALLLIGMICFRFYPINEKQRSQLWEQKTTIHPESSSALLDPKENTPQPTILQQHHADVTSALHDNTKTNRLYKSNSSPCYNSHYRKYSVKSSALSNVKKSKSLSGEYSRPKSLVQSNVYPQCHSQRLSPRQNSGEAKLGRKFPEHDCGPSSSRADVRSKVSWV